MTSLCESTALSGCQLGAVLQAGASDSAGFLGFFFIFLGCGDSLGVLRARNPLERLPVLLFATTQGRERLSLHTHTRSHILEPSKSCTMQNRTG